MSLLFDKSNRLFATAEAAVSIFQRGVMPVKLFRTLAVFTALMTLLTFSSDLALFNRRSEENIQKGTAVVAAGMAELESGDKHLEDVFNRADKRMYQQKKYLKSLGARVRE